MGSLFAVLHAADAGLPGPARPAVATGDVLLAHEPQLRRLVHRLLGWPAPQDVEDVVQEVLLAAWRRRDGFRGDAAIATWLFRIAVRKAQNHARWRALRRRWFARDHAVEAVASAVPPCAVERADDVRAVHAAMAALRHADREVLVLRYLEGRPIEAIAGLLGIARAAADARLSRARTRLRQRLGSAEDLR